MDCPAVQTGQRFLAAALEHIDCQAKTLGSLGYGGLADPGSPASLALNSLLTVFIAIFGIRLLLGYPAAGRDVVNDVVKIGIVLTLATSWPAWRILGYDLVINGPTEIARAIGAAAQLPGSGGDLLSRLQRADEGLAGLNVYGSGRLGAAQGDWFQLSFARSAFLTGTLGSLALIRLSAGILLAAAPLFAGLLLFGITRPIFIGWARGLFMTFLASTTLVLILGAQLALLEPWLQDALLKRAADQQTLDAPVEILVVNLAFLLVSFGALALIARIAFHPAAAGAVFWRPAGREKRSYAGSEPVRQYRLAEEASPSRASVLALSVSESVRRDNRMVEGARLSEGGRAAASNDGTAARAVSRLENEALGSSYRRNARRVSTAGTRRDQSQ